MTSSPAPSLYLKGVSIAYKQQILFENLNLTLQSANITCLLGPSGIGKSSLLRFIANLTLENVCGKVQSSDQAPLQNRIAWLTQHDTLLPWASVQKNVLIGAYLRGERISQTMQASAENWLAKVGLANLGKKRLHELSGGMRQRVALARLLFEDKPIVLLDEPFAALDALTRLQLLQLAAEWLKGRTVFWITHDIHEALRISHKIYVLQGKPAHISHSFEPLGTIPRDPLQPASIALQNAILVALGLGRLGRVRETQQQTEKTYEINGGNGAEINFGKEFNVE